jgi:predicted phosphodiesterase
MKYAVFSDIHGNVFALKAALADAERCGADRLLFIGDYTSRLPWAQEVTDVLRGLDNATVIRGNGEDYFNRISGKDGDEYRYEQMKLLYWAHRTMSKDNLDYLAGLPETAVVEDSGVRIHLDHSSPIFIRKPKIRHFSSHNYRMMMEEEPFTRGEYMINARKAVLESDEAVNDMEKLQDGVYLFGHNHLQFNMEHGRRLFVNPGSCGEALDYDSRAAYTLLYITESGWHVEERRVWYDVDATAAKMRESGFAKYSPFWCEFVIREFTEGKDYCGFFLNYLAETGKAFGETGMPVSNEVWYNAIRTWEVK